MAAVSADRDLLFGLLALQNGRIDQVQLIAAFQAWMRDKSNALAEHLEARGDLSPARRALLDALVEAHLEAHKGEVERSLAAIKADQSTPKTSLASATPRSKRQSATCAQSTKRRWTGMLTARRASLSAQPLPAASGSAF
jgi:hypothetical protein